MRAKRILITLCVLGMITASLAQSRRGRGRPFRGAPVYDRGSLPTWPVHEKFTQDVFTFARLKYPSTWERQSLAWYTDYPDADLNLSFRLQQLTALKVAPDPKLIEITDPNLSSYPWLFMSGVGNISLSEPEAAILRNYLDSGGFIFVDDFWGQTEWDNFYIALKQIFPNREPVDLPRSHPIFHCVFDLPDNLSLQTCNINAAVANRSTGITWEDSHEGGNTREIHFRAVFDDKNRMMMFISHNTDNGDGWEEEGGDSWFFTTFSEKKNYPLAINIIFYSMTQ